LNKSLLVCILLLLFFISTTYYVEYNKGYYTFSDDFERHFSMSKDLDLQYNTEGYPPFWRYASSIFSFNHKTYFFFSILIVCFVPIVLWFLFKNNWVVFFYLCLNFPFWFAHQLAVPQVIVSVWLLYFLFIKNKYFRFVSLILVMFVHSYGFVLFLLAWFCVLLVDFLKEFDFKGFLGVGLLPNSLNWVNSIVFGRLGTSLGDVVRFFGRDFNLFFLVLGVKGFVFLKRYDVLLLSVLLFFSGFVVGFRVFFTMSLLFLPGMAIGFEKLSKKWKYFYFVFGIFFVLLHFYTYIFEWVLV